MSGTTQVRIGCLDAIGAPLGLLRQHRPRRLLFGLSGGAILAFTVGGGAAADRGVAGSCAAPGATIVAKAGQARVFKTKSGTVYACRPDARRRLGVLPGKGTRLFAPARAFA